MLRSACRQFSRQNTSRSVSTAVPAAALLHRSFSDKKYLGIADEHFSSRIEVLEQSKPFSIFRVMDEEGKLVDGSEEPSNVDQGVDMYKAMVQLYIMDQTLYDAQRQGRVSFYMTSFGEGATHIGTASAMKEQDVVYGQYREAGVLLWRGFSLENFMNQNFGTEDDLGKGRQMPVHYGSKELNFHTISSPLGTQIPQAAGAGYALKLQKKDAACFCYFGDGAASEGDFHAALNFAAVLQTPTVFFCRNNGYAISTPVKDQYAGDGIAARGPGYGVKTMRIDGNDIWAVSKATARAREMAVRNNEPVLIEAMTYRIGHHSTSDDSTRYRTKEEIEWWIQHDDPIKRLRIFLKDRGLWDEEDDKLFQDEARQAVLKHLRAAEKKKKPPVREMFTDTYFEVPKHLREQEAAMHAHIQRHKEHYGKVLRDHAE